MKCRLVLFLVASAGTLFAQQAPVVKPRTQAKDYQAVAETANATVGVTQLSPKQVRQAFVSNMRKDYVVVEIGVYPKNAFKLSASDFALLDSDTEKLISAAEPRLMAIAINEKDQKGSDIAIYATQEISYTTGTVYDPNDPNRNDPRYRDSARHGGLSTATGAAVVIQPNTKDAKTSAADTEAMQAELTEKGLPLGNVSKPVAGYLYFLVTADKPNMYTLVYKDSDGTKVLIPLPKPVD